MNTDIAELSYIIPPLLGGAITIVLLVIAILWSRRDFTTLLFSGFLTCMALRNFIIFAMRISSDINQALIWERAVLIPAVATFVLYYHFTYVYTGIKPRKFVLYSIYAFLILVIAIAPTSLGIQRMEIIEYGYAPVVNPLGYIWFATGPLLAVGGAFNLIKSYKKTSVSEEKKRLLILAIAVLLPIAGMLWDGFTKLPPMSVWCNLMFAVLCTIAILKYHLLDIQFIIRKSLAYLMTSTIVAIPYVAIILMFNYIFGAGNIPIWAHIVLLLILALLVPALWQRAQQAVDRVFFRERYDYLRKLEAFSQETHDISDLKQLSNHIVNLIKQALEISGVKLMLLNENGDFITIASTGDDGNELVLSGENPVIKWFQSTKGILERKQLDIIPLLQAMTAAEKRDIEKTGAEAIIPLKTISEGTVIGLLLLGRKISEQPYMEDDRRMIATVAGQLSIELENARLYAAEMSTRRELQRQNDQKTEFLHTIAHELKTPLTSLIAAIELMTDTPGITGTQKQRLMNILKNSTEAMDRRVSELLLLAKMQTGDLELYISPLDINVFLTDIASRLTILFDQKKQILHLEIDKAQSMVNADKDRLEQIIFNLVANAIKYSPAYTDIVLRAKSDNEKVTIEVQDSAPLIDSEERKKLFDPYYRGKNMDDKEHLPGLGLGLYLVKRLVELHHGEVWIYGTEGKGNVFAFSLQAADKQGKNN